MKITTLAALAIACSTPAYSSDAFWNSYAAAGGFAWQFDNDPGPARVGCGPLGLGSNGYCRGWLFGPADQQAHGRCWIERGTLATKCER